MEGPHRGDLSSSRGGEQPPLITATTKLNFADNLNTPGSGLSPESLDESGAGWHLDLGLVRP